MRSVLSSKTGSTIARGVDGVMAGAYGVAIVVGVSLGVGSVGEGTVSEIKDHSTSYQELFD